MSEIPSFDDFKRDIITIYGNGDMEATYTRLVYYLEFLSDNYPTIGKLTYEFMIEKYRQFINQWNYLYKRKEQKGYLSKEAEVARKNFFDFIGGELFKEEYIIQKGSLTRDRYLFGNIAIEELERQLKVFKTIYTKKQSNGKT